MLQRLAKKFWWAAYKFFEGVAQCFKGLSTYCGKRWFVDDWKTTKKVVKIYRERKENLERSDSERRKKEKGVDR